MGVIAVRTAVIVAVAAIAVAAAVVAVVIHRIQIHQMMIAKSKEKRKEIHIRRKKNKRRSFRRKCHLVKRRIRTKNMDIMKGMGKQAKMKTMNVLKDIDKVM